MPAKIALLRSPFFQEHETGSHPENAQRLVAIDAALDRQPWIHDPSEVVQLTPEPAEVADVERAHTKEYLRKLHQIAVAGGGMLDMDTLMSEHSYDVAMQAAGASIQAVNAVLDGTARTSMALVRPPGHHARPSSQMGFCLINNAAVAALYALERRDVQRVAIVDFDVHHGNGTQEILEHDPRVLYCSLHQAPCYPFTGDLSETGVTENVLNIPLPPYSGDAEYAAAFEQLIVPKLRQFKPQLIIASAGYDAHWTNSRYVHGVTMLVTVRGFARMVQDLRDAAAELCDGRLVLLLEGGYEPAALAASVVASLDVLRGMNYADVTDTIGPARSGHWPSDVNALLERIRSLHKLP